MRIIKRDTLKLLRKFRFDEANFRLVQSIIAARQSVAKLRQRIIFLRRCLNNNIIPKFIVNQTRHIPRNSKTLDKKVRELQTTICLHEWKEARHMLYGKLAHAKRKESILRTKVAPLVYQEIISISKRTSFWVGKEFKMKLKRKFDRLVPGPSRIVDSIVENGNEPI